MVFEALFLDGRYNMVNMYQSSFGLLELVTGKDNFYHLHGPENFKQLALK